MLSFLTNDRRRLAWLAVPALATGVLTFIAGGFFTGTTALACLVAGVGVVLRLTTAERPWEGWSVALAVTAGAVALLAVWTLVSATWSDAPARAVFESDRALLYLFVLVLFGCVAARPGDLGLLLRWLAVPTTVTCAIALLTRLAPGTFRAELAIAHDRLSFPLTYWNAMGIFAALALVLALHVSSSTREPRVARVLAAAALPPVVMALYFTFSRGGIAAAVIGVVLYVLLAHPRGLLGALLAIVPACGFALREAYRADLLATTRFAEPVAASQRAHLLAVVAGCVVAAALLRWLALRLDDRLDAVTLPRPRRGVRWGAAAVALAALAVAVVVSGLPERIDRERREFSRGVILPATPDLRDRLLVTGNNGRIAHWRVARDAFQAAPAHGSGAGTYRLLWERDRPAPPFKVVDAHSLYLEVAAELGVPGLVVLLVALLTPLALAVPRLRGEERHAYAAFLAAGAMLLIHAGVDWDWEMPALFLWYFAAAGVVLAAREPRPAPSPRRLTRVLSALACLALLITPAVILSSEAALDRGLRAFQRDDCPAAIDGALDSLDAFGSRAEPYEILGYCDARAGQNALAVRAMRGAVRHDPDNWQYAYGLAVAQALAGDDPRPAARRARTLNPLDPLARDLERGLRSRDPARRRAVAARAKIPAE